MEIITDTRNGEATLDMLAFGPHPDDVEFGCSGLLAKTARDNATVGVVDMSYAELSSNGTVEERKKEAAAASDALGVNLRINLGIENNFFENSKENQVKVVSVLRQYQPSVVLVPHDFDRHPDHTHASAIIKSAVFNAGLRKYATGDDEVFRPRYIFEYAMWNEFEPSFIVDVSDVWESKKQALYSYESQFARRADTVETIDTDDRTLQYWEARARNYGFKINCTHGEPYRSVYFPMGVDSVFAFLPNLF